MSEFHKELLSIAERLEKIIEQFSDERIQDPLDRLEDAAKTIGKAWSGSWLGYQAYVYYKDLQSPPPGAHFSQEWGFEKLYTIRTTTGEWLEYDADKVIEIIHKIAGEPDIELAKKLSKDIKKSFDEIKSEIQSILTTILSEHEDTFLSRLKDDSDKLSDLSQTAVIRGMTPSGNFMTRDSLAGSQGIWTPPHLTVISEIIALRQPQAACEKLVQISKKAGSHMARKIKKQKKASEVGTNVFIGHGQSPIWKDLKDFVQDRLALPWDEFNRVPVAGITNIARLSEMLDSTAIAFLVMTGEDEQADGKLHARMNVVHEAGLFQGRLGFSRAIVLLEDGCEEFSNIQGLGQIRFPKGNMKAAFEEIRQLLEREGLI